MPDLVEVGTGGVFRAFRRRRHACPHGACDAPFGALRPAILVAVGCVNGAVSGRSIFQTRRRLRAQMTLRGALNTRREDGGAAPVRAARRERGTSLEFPGPGSAQAGLTARSGRQVNFSFKGNGIGDCRPDAACIPLSAGAVAGAGCSAGGPVAMLLRSSRFGSGHDRRKGGGQALKLASRLCRGCEPNVGEPFRERCGASRRSCRTARTPWRGLGTPGTGTPVEQNGF